MTKITGTPTPSRSTDELLEHSGESRRENSRSRSPSPTFELPFRPGIPSIETPTRSVSPLSSPNLRHLGGPHQRASASARLLLQRTEETQQEPGPLILAPEPVPLAASQAAIPVASLQRWLDDVAECHSGQIPVSELQKLVGSVQTQFSEDIRQQQAQPSGVEPVPEVRRGVVRAGIPADALNARLQQVDLFVPAAGETMEKATTPPLEWSGLRSRTTSVESNSSVRSSDSRQTAPLKRLHRFKAGKQPEKDAAPSPLVRSMPLPLELQEGTVMQKLGRGGQGTVFAVQPKVKPAGTETVQADTFAFKVSNNPRAGQRELEGSLKLRGLPNVMEVHGLYQIDNQQGILAEHLDGGPSGAFFASAREALDTGVITPKEFLGIIKHSLSDLLVGLGAMEERGVSHGDIKPENIMLSSQSKRLKIIDFGSARRLGEAADVATCYYTAPEITRGGQTATGKIDAFCAGQVLHHWFTGKPYDWADLSSHEDRALFAMLGKMMREAPAYMDAGDQSRLGAHFDGSIPPALRNLSGKEQQQLLQCRDVMLGLLDGDPERRLDPERAMEMDFLTDVRGLNTIGRIFEKVRNVQQAPVSSSENTSGDSA